MSGKLELIAQLREIEGQVERLTSSVSSSKESKLENILEHIHLLQTEVLHDQSTPMEYVKLARHSDRPHALDFINLLFKDFQELHGDRRYADDPAMVAGFAHFENKSIVVIGHQKANPDGRKTEDRKFRNFGMPKPEGYRKALRVMQLATKFNCPIVTFIDTPGAYPGIDAEERGQAEAIARNLIEMSRFPVPIIVTVIGEGGSGGALAIGVGDKVNMLQNTVYSVISPEGCAAILWKNAAESEKAATSLKITANELKLLNIIDEVIPEPGEGAHTDHAAAAALLKPYIESQLNELTSLPVKEMLNKRYEKFRLMGVFEEI